MDFFKGYVMGQSTALVILWKLGLEKVNKWIPQHCLTDNQPYSFILPGKCSLYVCDSGCIIWKKPSHFYQMKLIFLSIEVLAYLSLTYFSFSLNVDQLSKFSENTQLLDKCSLNGLFSNDWCKILWHCRIDFFLFYFIWPIFFPLCEQIFDGAIHVNVSHIIHDLSFGPKYPGHHNPLDGTVRILQAASGTFKYYIKVWFSSFEYE